jgi:hypothetical protein
MIQQIELDRNYHNYYNSSSLLRTRIYEITHELTAIKFMIDL